MVEQLLAIFCDVDDFCEEHVKYCTTHLLMDKSKVVLSTSMHLSEMRSFFQMGRAENIIYK